jgi:hypothetical protein
MVIDHVVYEISTGMLIQAQTGIAGDRGPLFASMPIPEQLLGQDMSPYYLVDGVFTLRPSKPSFELTSAVGQPLAFLNLSEGAAVEIIDRLNSRTSFAYDSSDPLVFSEAGEYRVSIEQLYPLWSVSNVAVEVTNA